MLAKVGGGTLGLTWEKIRNRPDGTLLLGQRVEETKALGVGNEGVGTPWTMKR